MKTLVLGGGESGVGAALLLRALGQQVMLSDSGELKPEHAAQLSAAGIPFEQGGHSAQVLEGVTEVVKSPGIAPWAPLVQQAQAAGLPVVGELELACRHTQAMLLGITGSNGKTTTTLLLHHLLQHAGLAAGLAGNVGHSLAAQVLQAQHQCYALEISSFQLEDMHHARLHAAAVLNVTEDHMDRYGNSMAAYAAAKYRIWRNQQAGDWAIANLDNDLSHQGLSNLDTPATKLYFSLQPHPHLGAWVQDHQFHFKLPEGASSIPTSLLPLPGQHNQANAMAAMLCAFRAGATAQQVAAALPSFANAPHRLQPVAQHAGVQWVNDSKATNVDAVAYALASYSQPLVLIMGGKDKGNDYAPLNQAVRQQVKAIVALGVDNAKIVQHFGPLVPVHSTSSMQQAVHTAGQLAQPGWVVLLSPACASFDLFKNYEDRGNQFIAQVQAWVQAQAPGPYIAEP